MWDLATMMAMNGVAPQRFRVYDKQDGLLGSVLAADATAATYNFRDGHRAVVVEHTEPSRSNDPTYGYGHL